MTHPETDEHVIQIKGWFHKYGKWIVGLIVIALLAAGAIHYLRSHNQAQLVNAAATFNELVAKLDPKRPEAVVPLAEFAKQENSSYGIFASLKAAQIYVMENKDYVQATALLTQALNKTKEEALQDILLIRIARLQLQQNLLDQSLETLDKVKSQSWLPMVSRIRGDIYLKQKQYEDSVTAYQMGLDSALNDGAKMAIEMKLNYAQYLVNKTSAQTVKKSETPSSQIP